MKHILNDIPNSEKQRILEQHSGGMEVSINNFQKLLSNKLGSVNPLLEQGDFKETSYVQPLIKDGYKVVNEINLPDGEYEMGGSGYQINIMSPDNKFTGYAIVVNNGIRGMWEGPITVTNKQVGEDVYKILFKESGYKPTNNTEENKNTVVNKVATEGIKNVTSQMISSPQFKGTYSGYVFGGVFNNIRYDWDCNGVENMMGIRGQEEGDIITETVQNMFSSTKQTMPEDAKADGVSVGFYNRSSSKFFIYTTTSGKVRCQRF